MISLGLRGQEFFQGSITLVNTINTPVNKKGEHSMCYIRAQARPQLKVTMGQENINA